MKNSFFLIILFFLFPFNSNSQNSDCEVVMESIQGEYEGSCKKGVASGEGLAIGPEDRYEGNFRKGLPNGTGKYIWGNGEWYQGNWKFGKRNGWGRFVSGSGELVGIWKEDEFLYEQLYEYPYEIIEKYNIKSLSFKKIPDNQHQITFVLKRPDAAIFESDDFRIVSSSGTEVFNSYQTIVTNVTFPFKADILFSAPNSLRTNVLPVRFRVLIHEPGNWRVTLVHN